MAGLPTSGALTLRSGEPFVLKLALADAEGLPQLLSSRAFLLTISRSGANAAAFTASAALSTDQLYAVMTFNGDATAAIYDMFAARAAEYAIIETIDSGQVTRGSGRVTVEPSPAEPSDADPIVMLVPFVEALAAPSAMLITEKGARGLSAAEQLAAAAIIGEPTVSAMDERYMAPSLEAAELASTAAGMANEKAALAQGVVDAQAANLQTVAAAVEQTGADREDVSNSKDIVVDARIDVAANASASYAHRLAAEQASVAAEDAAALAQQAPHRYSTISDGLAATAEGQFFDVIVAGDTYSTAYKVVSGVPVAINALAAKSMIDAFGARLVADSNNPDVPFSVSNAIGDILMAFRYSLGGLDVPNLRALAIAAASVAATDVTISNAIAVGLAALHGKVSSGNIFEIAVDGSDDIIARINAAGEFRAPAGLFDGNLTVGGILAALSLSLSGALAAGSVQLGGLSVTTSADGVFLLATDAGDIILKVDKAGKLIVSNLLVTEYATVVGGIYGSSGPSTLDPAPFATIAAADIAAINAAPVSGYVAGSARAPLLSTDTSAFGTRGAHLSGGVARTGSRTWVIGFGKLGYTTFTGYVVGTTLTIVALTNASSIAISPSSSVRPVLSGQPGVVVGTKILSAASSGNRGPGVYTLDTDCGTIGSAGSPVSFVSTDDQALGSEGPGAYAFLKYTDSLVDGPWKEVLYFIPQVSWSDGVSDPAICTTPDGRLLITMPMDGDTPYATRASYGLIINNPRAISGAFEVGRWNYLDVGIAMEPILDGGTLYGTMDEGTRSGATTHFGQYLFSGRDGVSFARISDFPKVPSADATFNESSVIPISGGRFRGYCRSSAGIYETLYDPIAGTWSAMTNWKLTSGFDTPDSRARFCRSVSGRLMAVFNNDPSSRVNLRAAFSEDSGATWPWSVLIESRSLNAQSPSYPATAFDDAGNDYIVYDFGRVPKAGTGTGIGKRLYVATISEAQVRAGIATEASVSKFVAST